MNIVEATRGLERWVHDDDGLSGPEIEASTSVRTTA
jgi:hypothetical protein